VSTPAPTRVVLADDQALIRSGIRLILELEPDLEVVGEATDGDEALRVAEELRPDIVLMDIRMPGTDGITATGRITQRLPRCRVLVLTTFSADRLVYDALAAGAGGFLLKDSSREHLVHAVRTIAAGEALLDPTVTRRLVERFVSAPVPTEDGAVPEVLRALSGRELDVMREVARGHSNAEIARALFISETTVKTYLTRLLAKLDLRDRLQVVVEAYETGLIRPGQES
jgi:DNA-binding NarL/FixJ family response regulator